MMKTDDDDDDETEMANNNERIMENAQEPQARITNVKYTTKKLIRI